MTVNESSLDRGIRAAIGIVLLLAWLLGWVAGTFAIVLGVGGIVLLATAAVGFCPMYRILGISTCPVPRR